MWKPILLVDGDMTTQLILFVVPIVEKVSWSDIRFPNSSALKLANLQPGR
jgi:hypothetical protein